jgi:hypothetical protein
MAGSHDRVSELLSDRDASPQSGPSISPDRAMRATPDVVDAGGQMDALCDGSELPRPDTQTARFLASAMHDADIFRAYLETRAALGTTREVLDRQALNERIDRGRGSGPHAAARTQPRPSPRTARRGSGRRQAPDECSAAACRRGYVETDSPRTEACLAEPAPSGSGSSRERSPSKGCERASTAKVLPLLRVSEGSTDGGCCVQ